MDEKLRGMLAEGETLLWSGRPVAFETMDRTNGKHIMTGIIVKALLGAATLILYILLALRSTVGVKPGVIAFIVLIVGFALCYPFLTARRLRNNTYYGLTDRRILRIGAKEEAVPYQRIRKATLRTDEDGQYTLLCGSPIQNLKPSRWRSEADVLFIDDPNDDEARSVVLYALPMNGVLRGILKKYLSVE